MMNVQRKIKTRRVATLAASGGKTTGLIKTYSPKLTEAGWYKWWEDNCYFQPNSSHIKDETFSMILPPPNVTGTLHLGHALTVSIQDVLVRWHRMQGHSVIWVPGTDHAGIATQVVVEKILKERHNQTRYDLGRRKFIDQVWKWKREKGQRISEQLRMLGASLDWSQEFFTMDQKHEEAVAKAVVTLWEKGLLYKTESLVSWSCKLRSAISDIEVDHLSIIGPTRINIPDYEQPVTFGQLMNFAYKFLNDEGEIVVSTTRLETMLGDVAVAVNPNDARYKAYIGKYLCHPFIERSIPVIQDESVDPNFGTGAVKITPAHNQQDFEIAKKHNLPIIPVINEDGTIHSSFGKFSGMKRFEAREEILKALGSLHLLRGINDHDMQLPLCSRSRDVIELIIKPQWFVRSNKMAELAADAVRNGSLMIEPEHFIPQWYSWLDNIRDWCISRQLWWGHRLPLYHCESNDGSLYIGALHKIEAMEKAQKVLSGEIFIKRETDVLDTWFSSALLPFTSFGWPEQTKEFNLFYPLSTMVTGHDIMFFWVARMVMLGSLLTGKLPFKKVMLHGIICDSQGRKMSKSRGNVLDPEDIINGSTLEDLKQRVNENYINGLINCKESQLAMTSLEEQFPQGIPECGRDALRFTLLSYKVKSHYIRFNVSDCYANRMFCNKIWQACRFLCDWAKKLSMNKDTLSNPVPKNIMDRWILSELSIAVNTINSAIPEADYHKATGAIRDFVYSDFCDTYLEYSKPLLRASGELAVNTCHVLLYCLYLSIKCIAPFMPHLAEELYNNLPLKRLPTVMYEKYPKNLQWEDAEISDKVSYMLEICAVIRHLKLTSNVKNKKNPTVWLVNQKTELQELLPVIKTLGKCGEIILCERFPQDITNFVSSCIRFHEIYIETEGNGTEKLAHVTVLKKKIELEKELNKLLIMTNNKGYEKAPIKIRQSHLDKISKIKFELNKLAN